MRDTSIGSQQQETEGELLEKEASLHLRCEKAESIIKNNVIQALALGLIPAPVVDIVSLVNVQYRMTHDLARLYGIHYQKLGRMITRSLVVGMLPVITITGLSSMLKIMPGIGSLAGGAGVSISSGGLTYAIGKIFLRHFEAGGTMDNFDLAEARKQFKSEFKSGCKEALRLSKNASR